jgi:hypothetical protein
MRTGVGARVQRVERYGPGEGIASPWPGDFLLIRGHWWISRVIHGGQLIRFRTAADRPYAHWSHVALVASFEGRIIEVNDKGVVARHIERYRALEYHYVRIHATGQQRLEAVRYAESCVGEPYARLAFLALGASVFTGGLIRVGERGQQMCGSLVARALARTDAVFDRRPAEMTPADLAKHYNVRCNACLP